MYFINGIDSEHGGSIYEQVLDNFYQAFNTQNFYQMQNNWSNDNKVVMCNPLGGKKVGWLAIKSVYQSIFNGPAKVYVEFYDYTLTTSTDMFCAAGRERGYFDLNGERIDLDIRTTRFYRKVSGDWKQYHHHGSIDRPDLLLQYQQAVSIGSAHKSAK